MLAAVSVLSACATTYDSAGSRYFSVWPFIGSRNPDLQLNYPVQDPKATATGQRPGSLVLDNSAAPDRPQGDFAVFAGAGRS